MIFLFFYDMYKTIYHWAELKFIIKLAHYNWFYLLILPICSFISFLGMIAAVTPYYAISIDFKV